MEASAKTAKTRKEPSAPMQWLEDENLLEWGRCLDYGCGKGFDADFYGMEKFDPNHFPEEPTGLFDTITCNYVLNVVPEVEGNLIIRAIHNLMSDSACAYITVRRDVKVDGLTKSGTFQRNVVLDLPVIYQRTGRFCIYGMGREYVNSMWDLI